VQVSYIPSVRIWFTCRERARTHPAASVPNALVIGNPLPQPEAPSLPGAEEEARQVSELFRREAHGFLHVFQTEQATRKAILEDLKINGALLSHAHFACHALAELNDPQRSGLFLANGERLMVRDLFDPANQLHFDHLRLVTLSACQTGVPGTELPDEVVGLPASWLQAGAIAVVASLWPVSDVVTVALMTKFYELHLSDGLDPADALWLAQRWLRGLPEWKHNLQTLGAVQEAAGPEVSEVAKGLALSGNTASSDNPADAEENDDGGLDPNPGQVQHWNNPLYWAAFAMYGA
jgi:CHAT domain-containing protein